MVLPLIIDGGTFCRCSPDLYTCKTSSKASSVSLTLCFSSPIAKKRPLVTYSPIMTCLDDRNHTQRKRRLTCGVHYLIHERLQHRWRLMRQQIDEEISGREAKVKLSTSSSSCMRKPNNSASFTFYTFETGS